MTQHLHEKYESWIGRTLNDASGNEIGQVEDIYTDDDTGQPEWLAIVSGRAGSNVSFVPVAGATPTGEGLQVQYPKDQVTEAPNAGSDGKLSEEEEAHLYAHYGLDYDQERVRLQRWVESERVETGPETGTRTESEGERMPDSDARRPLGTPGIADPDDELRGRHEVTPVPDRPGSSWAHDEEIEDDHPAPLHTRTEPVEVGSEGVRR